MAVSMSGAWKAQLGSGDRSEWVHSRTSKAESTFHCWFLGLLWVLKPWSAAQRGADWAEKTVTYTEGLPTLRVCRFEMPLALFPRPGQGGDCSGRAGSSGLGDLDCRSCFHSYRLCVVSACFIVTGPCQVSVQAFVK